ncbi:Sensor_kinase_SpoOB-type, alpha-helical domain [Clostridium amylolyticum]|uniref:Sensor_kinase_SpoOB-type, alpha-helical domain n=1 Tax=Clostridium amylolyticum TaxID=1121298 RepID=A0A1M6NY25_9CLOT|nr:GHKL domain-containing protein [Clostridium amylolyticum]SHK00541.1 Sensor_kinase_SpoOB-type, alpha-helical domain [Clostridium amylolyticum]
MTNRKKAIYYLFLPYIIQLFIIIFIARKMFIAENVEKHNILSYWLIGIVIISEIINFFLAYKLMKEMDKNNELAIVKSEFKNTEALIDLFRKQGHDHINHIQTVNSMLMLDEQEIAINYLQGIAETYRFSGQFLRLGNPTLTAVVNTKKELANQKGIEFIVLKYCRVKLSKIKPWDIASIIGNLLDNSIEYLLMHKELPQKIYFHVENTEDMKGYIFKIRNHYKQDNINLNRLFEQGFSTKANAGRGYGLYIVKELLEGYGGKIEVNTSEDSIIFTLEVGDKNV